MWAHRTWGRPQNLTKTPRLFRFALPLVKARTIFLPFDGGPTMGTRGGGPPWDSMLCKIRPAISKRNAKRKGKPMDNKAVVSKKHLVREKCQTCIGLLCCPGQPHYLRGPRKGSRKDKKPWINETKGQSLKGILGRAACCGLWQALHATSKQVLSAQFSSSFAHRVDNSVSFARRLAFLRKAQPYQDTPLARCKSCVSKRLLCETPGLFGKGITL